MLADRHRRTHLAWCLARRGWNLRTWRKIHWSNESRFLLHVNIHPKPLLSFHRKGQLAGCSLGNRLYFCVSIPASGLRLHEAEIGSRLTNGSCAMSHPANCPLRWKLSNGLGCISHDCKLDLVTIQGNLAGDQYIRDVLQPVVIPHFDNHPLATWPVYMDDNDRRWMLLGV
jgi:hypothetical protein